MRLQASPQEESVSGKEPSQRAHSGEGSDSAWQALQQVARTKPRVGLLPIRSPLQERFAGAKKTP